jgi:hypothetical protein
MAEPARAPENASYNNMVATTQAAEFWAAVEDCLVEFHNFTRPEAAQKVTDLWRRLSDVAHSLCSDSQNSASNRFADMIYHAEPWYIACNLAENEIPIGAQQGAYDNILRRNHLA